MEMPVLPSRARCDELLQRRITYAGQCIDMERRQIRYLTEHVAEARRHGWEDDIVSAYSLIGESQLRMLQLQDELRRIEQQLWNLRFGEDAPSSRTQPAQECCLA
jgi:hypothetical protein